MDIYNKYPVIEAEFFDDLKSNIKNFSHYESISTIKRIIGPNLEDYSISIKFIIVPSFNNIYYDIYADTIRPQSVLFSSLNNNLYFDLIYENLDFKIYEFTQI